MADKRETNPYKGTQAVYDLLVALGIDVTTPGRKDTPSRVFGAFQEMLFYQELPEHILATTFESSIDELVVLNKISFVALCEHHMLPFSGTATVGYLPNGKVVGISKLARLVTCFSKALTIQERMTESIAKALMEYLTPRGVGVILKAHHSCMSCRGVMQSESEMVTSCLLGDMRNSGTREEFLSFR